LEGVHEVRWRPSDEQLVNRQTEALDLGDSAAESAAAFLLRVFGALGSILFQGENPLIVSCQAGRRKPDDQRTGSLMMQRRTFLSLDPFAI
jgi:hypothetical protein